MQTFNGVFELFQTGVLCWQIPQRRDYSSMIVLFWSTVAARWMQRCFRRTGQNSACSSKMSACPLRFTFTVYRGTQSLLWAELVRKMRLNSTVLWLWMGWICRPWVSLEKF